MKGLWSSGMTAHSHCANGSSILPRSTKRNFARNLNLINTKAPNFLGARGLCTCDEIAIHFDYNAFVPFIVDSWMSINFN